MDAEVNQEAVSRAGGWTNTAGPNETLLPFELCHIDESALCLRGRPTLYGLGRGPTDYHEDREKVVLVHGIQGVPADLQSVVGRLCDNPRYQLHVVAYDSYHQRTSLNGRGLADELAELRSLGAGSLTLIAHSMGGIVAMQAITHLVAGVRPSSGQWPRIRLLGIDNPWHGYPGPGDSGAQGVLMQIARPFMPAGLDDMRAQSRMFVGDPQAETEAERAGLLNLTLPENIAVHLAFSQEATEVFDYTRDRLAALPPALLAYFTREVRLVDKDKDPMVWNFWKALLLSAAYGPFQHTLRAAADAGTLTLDGVQEALGRYFPRFPGDHMGVLAEHSGQRSFLDWMQERLAAE